LSVHKDFHGALSCCLEYIYKKYGEKELDMCLRQIARNVYKPLIESLKSRGLAALEEHWRRIFTIEGGDFDLHYDGDVLVLNVKKCPAIWHMRERGYRIFEKFCEHCRIVNDEICKAAGYNSSVDYDQDAGSCTQKFWRRREG